MTSRRSIAFAAALLAAALPLRAGEAASEGRSPWILVPNVRIWGADMTVGYRGLRILPGVDSVLWAHLGGGWEGHALYRDFSASPVVGVPVAKDDPAAPYSALTIDWQVGLSQGILFSERLDRNLLEAVFLAKQRLDRYYQNAAGSSSFLADSSLPDRGGIVLTSFLLALRWDGVEVVKHRQTRNGLYGELSAEWAPAGLFGSPADYLRLDAHLSGLVTLVDRPRLALVAGDRVEGDLLLPLSGDLVAVPAWARSTLGGMNPDGFGGESGLGGAVRGVASERFDGTLKLVNNLELRLLFPDILPVAIFPGLIAYLDAGAADYRGLDRRIDLPGDLFVSAGAGLYLRALVADLVLYGSYCLAPADAAGFAVDFRFSTQF